MCSRSLFPRGFPCEERVNARLGSPSAVVGQPVGDRGANWGFCRSISAMCSTV